MKIRASYTLNEDGTVTSSITVPEELAESAHMSFDLPDEVEAETSETFPPTGFYFTNQPAQPRFFEFDYKPEPQWVGDGEKLVFGDVYISQTALGFRVSTDRYDTSIDFIGYSDNLEHAKAIGEADWNKRQEFLELVRGG